jgi:RNA-directed DNA polymerase
MGFQMKRYNNLFE